MDLEADPRSEAIRDEIRTFLAAEWRPERAASAAPEVLETFRRAATDAGYFYRWVPRRYGGSERPSDPLLMRMVREEFGKAHAPLEITTPGVKMLVPTLLAHGREDQKLQFIRKTIVGEYVWCQGYSEPGTGSDLASLKTRGRVEHGEWLINGQKLWTSHAHRADFMFALVRTEPDAERHQGISFLLIDMKQAQISVQPLREMTGIVHFNEVFLDDARTPLDWIVGARGQGWQVSRTTLKHERDSIGSAQTGEHLFDRLLDLSRKTLLDGVPAITLEDVRQDLARIEGFVLAQKCSSYFQSSMAAAGRETPIFSMVNKLVATDIGHDVARLAQKLLGDDALLMPSGDPGTRRHSKWVNQIMGSLGVAIAGGTSNIQRNIIAERGLGLPRS